MYGKLKLLGLNTDKTSEEKIDKFSSKFLEYNKNINLISKNDMVLLFEKHIFDSLAFNLFYKKYIPQKPLKILDIGTGGGFPSIPLALIYKNCSITAVDSINKKINVIKQIKQELNIENLIPLCGRVEDISELNKDSFDVVTSRAMSELRIILEYSIPFVKTGGYFIAYKSVKAEDEITKAKNALKILNSQIVDEIEYSLPIEEENRRVLLVIKKIDNTPNIYPRKNGLINKKPL